MGGKERTPHPEFARLRWGKEGAWSGASRERGLAGWRVRGGCRAAEVRRERGGRRNRRRRGRSRVRSCHPAAGPRQTTPARGGARTARTHSPNNAPRLPAGRLQARRPTAKPRHRSPEVSPPRFYCPIGLYFFFGLAPEAAERESFGGAPRSPSGRPPVADRPGDRRPIGESGAKGPRAPEVAGAQPGGTDYGEPRGWGVYFGFFAESRSLEPGGGGGNFPSSSGRGRRLLGWAFRGSLAQWGPKTAPVGASVEVYFPPAWEYCQRS